MRFQVVVFLMAFCLLAPASIWGDVTFNSGPGVPIVTLVCDAQGPSPAQCGAGTSVAVGLNPAYEPNDPLGSTAVWMSNDDSGQNGVDFQPQHDSEAGPGYGPNTEPIYNVLLSFSIAGPSVMTGEIWADDTAGVYLFTPSGVETVFSPILNQNSTCSGAIIGCVPGDGGLLGVLNAPLDAGDGTYTLEIQMYQSGTGLDTGSNPFGLLYTVSVEGVTLTPLVAHLVPEAGTLLLLAFMGSFVFGTTKLLRKRA